MLEDMEAALAAIAGFFGFDAPAERVREIAQGPLMSRYSKALEYDYSPSLRRQLIEQEFALYRAEIDDALAMLDAVSAGIAAPRTGPGEALTGALECIVSFPS